MLKGQRWFVVWTNPIRALFWFVKFVYQQEVVMVVVELVSVTHSQPSSRRLPHQIVTALRGLRRGLPAGKRTQAFFRGLIGPMTESKHVVRYETPEVFETLTKEWGDAKTKRRKKIKTPETSN